MLIQCASVHTIVFPMKAQSLSFAGISLLCLASCSLPPSKAWRIVKTEGLLPYVAMELGKKPFPPGMGSVEGKCCPAKATPPSRETPPPSLLAVRQAAGFGNPYLQLATLQPVQRVSYVSAPTKETPASPARPAVRSVTAVSRPVVPANVGASVPVRPLPRTASAPVVVAQKPVVSVETGASAAPRQEPMTKPKVQASVPPPLAAETKEPSPKPTPKPEVPVKEVVPPVGNMAATAKKSDVTVPVAAQSEVPYGMPIPGRPGFVHSPFTGKLQIVDVTGLQADQEVKCPFSGKLFRIPAAALNPSAAAPAPESKAP